MGVDDAVISADVFSVGSSSNLRTFWGMSYVVSFFRLLSRNTSELNCLEEDFCAY